MAKLTKLQKQLSARTGQPKKNPPNVLLGLTNLQLAFILDKSQFKAAICSRQAGKTEAALAYLTAVCLSESSSNCLYINRTLKQAKATIWQRFADFFRRFSVEVKFNQVEQTITFPNGSIIYISGAQDMEDADRFRGAICRLAIIDESQGFRPEILAYLLTKVLPACLLKHQGTTVLLGTPDTTCVGYFYEVTEQIKKGYSIHSWTYRQNPGIENPDAFITKIMNVHGWQGDEPEYLSEWEGKWTKDVRSLLFNEYLPIRNEYTDLPKDTKWSYAMGTDVGVRDACAFVVIAWSMSTPYIHVLESYSETNMIPSTYGKKVEEYIKRYPGLRVIQDAGALGLGYAEELRRTFAIPIEGADKRQKATRIRMINDQFRLGNLKLQMYKTAGLKKQLLNCRFDPKTQIEHKTDACDELDAMLYAYGYVYSFLYREPPPPLTPEQIEQNLKDQMYAETVHQFRSPEERLQDENYDILNSLDAF